MPPSPSSSLLGKWIRKYRAASYEDLSQIQGLAEKWAQDGETIGLVAPSLEELARHLGGCFFVAADSGEVVGFVYGVTRVSDAISCAVFEAGSTLVDIEDVYVMPSHRSAGIVALLLEAVVDWARHRHVRYLSAYSATRDVDRVLRFYRSCGFDTWSVQVFRDVGWMMEADARGATTLGRTNTLKQVERSLSARAE